MARRELDRINNSSDEEKACIRVGHEYQAHVPPFADPEALSSKQPEDKSEKPLTLQGNTELEVCLWRVNDKIPERKIDEFVTTAFREHGWSQEQALGILFLKNFNFRKAIDLRHTFEPVESVLESFTDDDKNAFFYAYKIHGKEFRNIHELMPHKKLSELITFYYLWKRKSGLKEKINAVTAAGKIYDYQMTEIDMSGLEPNEVDTETLLNNIFKAPEIVKNKEERKLEHEIYQTNQSIQNLKQKIEIQQLESKNLLKAYDNVDDILKERKIGSEEVTTQFTAYEVAALLKALTEFGPDFSILARIIPTKTPESLKRFFEQKKKLIEKHCSNIRS